MPLRNATEYLATIEYRDRLRTALNVARRNLTPKEFASFASSIEAKVQDAEKDIAEYETDVVATASSIPANFLRSLYSVEIAELRPTVPAHSYLLMGSPRSPVVMLGFSDSRNSEQLCLPW